MRPTNSSGLRDIALLVVIAVFIGVSSAAFGGVQPWDQSGSPADPNAVLNAANAIPVDRDSDVDVLLVERRYVIDQQGCVTQTSRWVYRVNTTEGVKNWGEVSAIWEPWHQVKPEIEVRVITRDGAAHMLDTKTLVDAPARNNAEATFDDDRKYHGPIPAVSIGSIIEENVVMRDTAPFFDAGDVKRIWFGTNMPVQQTRLVIEAPTNSPLRYNLHQLPNASVKKEQIEGRTRITIENGPLEAIRHQYPNLPHDVPRRAHVDFTTAASWQDVAKRYSKAVEEQIRPAEVKSFLPVKTPASSGQAAIQTLVSQLHKEVRYTGVEFGRSKIVPVNPAEVLKRKYGDCKDKATLLVAMLRASGVPANLALLTASDAQDAEDDMPGLNLFDHAIVFVPGGKNMRDLWIDATAEFTPVGELPSADQGRMALVISDHTAGLSRTPEAMSTDTVNIEKREFFLSEFGPARVVETSQWSGNQAGYLRYYYETLTDDKRKNLENYLKNTYLAESLTKVDVSDARDMTKPFVLRLESEKAKRGTTGDYDAVVAMWPAVLLNNLPQWLRQPEEEDKDDKSAKKKPARTEDFLLPEAFVYEWRYRIVPPAGFQAHGLPENKTIAIGPAKLTEEFKAGPDGVVTGIVRFDTVKRRYTLAEAKDIQTAVQKALKAPATLISFDSTGYVLLKAGKIRESLAAFRSLIAQHPKEGLHHAQLASVLLEAGLGEPARTEARQATTLDPGSVIASRTLGWILQHDLVGRRFERGFDLDGSVAAYRKAIELDPKDVYLKADLAILLEHAKDGERYSPKAKLEESIALYREIRDQDKKNNTDYDDNLVYDLLYAGRFKEAQSFVSELSPTSGRTAVLVAAVAADNGAEKAIEQSSVVSQNENDRGSALYNAGILLARMRMYPEALKLMTAGAGSQTNSPQVLGAIEAIRNTRRIEDIAQSTNTPEEVVRAAMITLLIQGDPAILKFSSKNSLDDGKTEKERLDEVDKSRRQFHMSLKNGEWPVAVAQDMTFSNLKLYKDGDDATGYNVTMEWMGASPEHLYVVKEDGAYKILAAAGSDMADIGREALSRISRGDVHGTRKLLDWAREKLSTANGDDPLSGAPAARFWTRGQEADKDEIEYAAAALMTTDRSATRAVPILERGLAKATTDSERLKFDLALAGAYSQAKQWKQLAQAAEHLLKAEPRSDRAMQFLTEALTELRDWTTLEKAIQARLQKTPDDAATIRFAARVKQFQSNYQKYREITHSLIDNGKAESDDMNGYAWAALYIGSVSADDIEIARRALSIEKNRSFAIMHTLACLYAEVGKTKEARDLLINAMELGDLDEPNEAIWFGFGRIAEHYGEYEGARKAYERVEKPEDESVLPVSTYTLAASRLRVIYAQLKGHSAATGK